MLESRHCSLGPTIEQQKKAMNRLLKKKKAPVPKNESPSKSSELRPISKSTEFRELVKDIQKNERT